MFADHSTPPSWQGCSAYSVKHTHNIAYHNTLNIKYRTATKPILYMWHFQVEYRTWGEKLLHWFKLCIHDLIRTRFQLESVTYALPPPTDKNRNIFFRGWQRKSNSLISALYCATNSKRRQWKRILYPIRERADLLIFLSEEGRIM